MNILTTTTKALLASYGRSVLAGVLTLLMFGANNLGDYALALVAALIPVTLRALNSKDAAFGVLPTKEEVDAAVQVAVKAAAAKATKPEAKKAPDKKAAAKKAPAKKTTKKATDK